MRFPIGMTMSLTRYIAGKRLRRVERFPLVMMLEPLHACNLTCTGCGRIREYKSTITDRLTVEQCLHAADECGAPIVSICGGEPTIYRELHTLVAALIARKRHVYVCTHGMFLRKRLHEFTPTPRMFFNVHLDGLEDTHDLIVEKKGVFREAIEGIKAAKAAGFLVCTNTTIYKQTDIKEIAALFGFLSTLGVDGFMVSPAYSYAAVQTKELFMTRAEVHQKFRQAEQLLGGFRLMTSPIYLDYLRGNREEMQCAAWANPTYNPRGWKAPCYLITDEHHETYRQFVESTPWERYGRGRDPRCENCMVHVGYEPAAVLGANRRMSDSWTMLRWQLTSPDPLLPVMRERSSVP